MLFSGVVGQQELKEHLIGEVKKEKVSHAQLFLGPSGHGSLPMALAFVQYLFCENKQNQDSCNECSSCRKVSNLQHPDLHFSFPTVQTISKTSDPLLSEWRSQIEENPYFDLNTWIRKMDPKERKPIIGKDESYEIVRKLSLRSYEGGYKVMIIWMAEEMNTTCANKLLKMIEEPPAKTLFILISASQDYMLKTILSRTQIVMIPRIDNENITEYLKSAKQIGASDAISIAGRSEGNLLEAEEYIGDHFEQDENRDLFVQLMRVCYKKAVLDMMHWAETVSATSKEHQKVFLKYALHMFRQSMLRNYTENQLTQVSNEEEQFLLNFSKFITGNNVIDLMEAFSQAHYHIDRNANGKILFTNLCFQVMRFIHVS